MHAEKKPVSPERPSGAEEKMNATPWNLDGRTVLLCTMKHAASQFMYLPILRTLDAGFRDLGAAEVLTTAGGGPVRRSKQLVRGDVLVWVGSGRAVEQLPLSALGARGVRRVIYGTEPMRECHGVPATIWDEV